MTQAQIATMNATAHTGTLARLHEDRQALLRERDQIDRALGALDAVIQALGGEITGAPRAGTPRPTRVPQTRPTLVDGITRVFASLPPGTALKVRAITTKLTGVGRPRSKYQSVYNTLVKHPDLFAKSGVEWSRVIPEMKH